MSAKYGPLRFLASLGNGGMVITFFLYLNFLIPHKDTPIVAYASWLKSFQDGPHFVKALIILALLGVVVFALRHFYYLIDNIRMYNAQNYTEEQKRAIGRERMVIPLTLSMSVNVCFIVGSLFVPGLWQFTEYLFPVAGLTFLVIGLVASKIFVTCFTNKILTGEEKVSFNNLSRLIPVFTFSMVAVGLGAPAAMSHIKLTASISAFFSLFFISIAIFFGFIQLIVGFGSIIKEGIDKEGSASLWIMIPILTILGIALVRLIHFLEHHLGFHATPAHYFVLISILFSIQIFLGVLGYTVMKRNGYFSDYIKGEIKSYGTYSLICPGVAFFVMGMFMVQLGIIKTFIIPKFSIAHIILLCLLVIVQIKTIRTIFVLDKKLL